MRLDHPTIPGVSVDVPKRDVKRWQASGWVEPTPHVPADEPGESTTAPRERAATEGN